MRASTPSSSRTASAMRRCPSPRRCCSPSSRSGRSPFGLPHSRAGVLDPLQHVRGEVGGVVVEHGDRVVAVLVALLGGEFRPDETTATHIYTLSLHDADQ